MEGGWGGGLGFGSCVERTLFFFFKKKTEFKSGMIFLEVEKNSQPESSNVYAMLKVIFEHILRRMFHVYYLYLLLS